MSYESMHPEVTAACWRTTTTEVETGKERRTATKQGDVVGGYEDRATQRQQLELSGKVYGLMGILYCDAAQDIPVFRGDVMKFTDAATAQTFELVVVNRTGPFDSTDEEDHIELWLGSEQPTKR